jgi:hypothetical protein
MSDVTMFDCRGKVSLPSGARMAPWCRNVTNQMGIETTFPVGDLSRLADFRPLGQASSTRCVGDGRADHTLTRGHSPTSGGS